MQATITNPNTLKNQLQEDIKKGNLKKALDYLLKITKDDDGLHNQVILLNTSLSGINESFIKGMLSPDDKNQAIEELGQRTLIFIEGLSKTSFLSNFHLFVKQNLAICIGLVVGVLLLSFGIFRKLELANPMDKELIVSAMNEKLQGYKSAMCVELRFQKNGTDKIFSEAERDYEQWKGKYLSEVKNSEHLKDLEQLFNEIIQIKKERRCLD